MTWDADFYSALMSNSDFNTVIDDQLSKEFDADATAPYANYQLIYADGTDDLDGVGLEGGRLIQLSIWALSPSQCEEIGSNAIKGALSQLQVMSVYQRSLGYDGGEKLFGYAVDFTVWFDTP